MISVNTPHISLLYGLAAGIALARSWPFGLLIALAIITSFGAFYFLEMRRPFAEVYNA